MTASSTGIEQINLGFHEAEDRLLLKLGLLDKTEISVWLTRRLTKLVWRLLQSTTGAQMNSQKTVEKQLLTANKAEALADFSREVNTQKNIEKMDFKKDYDTEREKRTEAPLLATQAIVVSLESAGQSQSAGHLELRCQNGQTVKIALNPEIIHAMVSMMQLATREAGWDLLFDVNTTGFNIEQTKALLH